MQDRHIITIQDRYDIIYKLLNGMTADRLMSKMTTTSMVSLKVTFAV